MLNARDIKVVEKICSRIIAENHNKRDELLLKITNLSKRNRMLIHEIRRKIGI